MKFIFWIALFMPFLALSQEPEIWGLTYEGGKSFGTIFKTDANGENFETVHLFGDHPGQPPSDRLYLASNGKMYGTNWNYGALKGGNFYEYDPVTNESRVIANFRGNITGKNASEVVESNGKLYGATQSGSAQFSLEHGAIFEYDMALDSFRIVHKFNSHVSGGPAMEGFCADTNGFVYGTAFYGPTLGVIFKYDPFTEIYSPIYKFNDSLLGYAPRSVMISSKGDMYGITFAGGTNELGVIFKFDVQNLIYTKLWDFDSLSGHGPMESLMELDENILVGVAGGGSTLDKGALFEFNLKKNRYRKLADLGLKQQAGFLYPSDLASDSSGNIYGTTMKGGLYDKGVIFKYDTSTSIYSEIYNFSYGINGYNPEGVIMYNNNLYGICGWGGEFGLGAIFNFDLNSHTFTPEISFYDVSEGAFPTSSMIQASNGKVYGLSPRGGEYNHGLLYEIDVNTGEYKVKYSLGKTASDGFGITENSLVEFNKELYGMTMNGGISNEGTIFKYDFVNDTGVTLYRFIDSIGGDPMGSLVVGPDSLLYGTSQGSPIDFGGAIFSFNPRTSEYRILHSFDPKSSEGGGPSLALVYVGDSKFYGIAEQQDGDGVLYEFDLSTNKYQMKYQFIDSISGRLGNARFEGLLKARNGKLYGTNVWGGLNNNGVFYSYDLETDVFTKIIDFDTSDYCCNTSNKLIHASNNKIYGTAQGFWKPGVLFEYDITLDQYSIKHEFRNVKNGLYPWTGLLEVNAKYTSIRSYREKMTTSIYPNPNDGHFYINLNELNSKGKYEIQVFNTLGSIVYQQTILKQGNIQITLPKYLNNGVYLVQLTGEKIRASQRIIVQRQ